MQIIDISVPIVEGMAVWEGDPLVSIERVASIDNDGVNVSKLSFSLHTGTHIDAPLHYLKEGNSTDQILLEKMIGDALVIEVPDDVNVIEAIHIQNHIETYSAQRLLIKTRNSRDIQKIWKQFSTDFVALSPEAASLIAELNFHLIGIDAPSIAQYGTETEIHCTFLKKDIVILEGLDLSHAQPGKYRLICLPLKITGVDGTPVRAVLLP